MIILKTRLKMLLRQSAGNGGFTLIELMIVIAILAILGAFAVNTFKGVIPSAKITAAKTDINNFSLSLEQYNLQNQRYPSSEEGLQKLVTDGYLKSKLLDPWKNPYQYRYPGQFGDAPEIWSYGADGVEGGEGDNADIKSWE
ncbi:MAG TPA: type II secretion system major pseudopilin GspG [Spirochaetota bacterium]|nr:type II secretion system major pseudopilin GspG [Spirochaetota bacterium]HPF04432.1 type II secretion system major pseudopilin GspG [Spirochaetota bacterium]HPJ40796.1 type II secretion system major pseudopilin GspG [Spirochaetota bacterium]HPR36065.1 type II secretion system major pseudopilin GspG [Spirochaetota bacterium]HRX45979.1 type II secretion system major pseudopilin GspG [Spirochaetota bacterium]